MTASELKSFLIYVKQSQRSGQNNDKSFFIAPSLLHFLIFGVPFVFLFEVLGFSFEQMQHTLISVYTEQTSHFLSH